MTEPFFIILIRNLGLQKAVCCIKRNQSLNRLCDPAVASRSALQTPQMLIISTYAQLKHELIIL